ncbi:MAG: cardiolipin synthase, partial [Planctomycetota bacterium]
MLLAEPALSAVALHATFAVPPIDDWLSSLWANLWSWQALLVALAIVGEVLSVMFVYRVLVRGGSAASTLLWMAVILVTPWFGLMLYYLLPRSLQLRRLRRMQQSERRLREVRPRDAANASTAEQPTGLERLLQLCGGLSDGNELRWLPGGEDFFAAAATVIEAAKQHVHCVVYILRPDETGLRFLALLTEAAKRGVQVRLCFDSFGSWGLNTAHLQELRAAGGKAVPFLPLLWKRRPFTLNLRNHRKLLIVDGEVAFLGGRNIADEYRHDRVGKRRRWYDAMMEVRGPAVDRLQDVFVQDWCTAADEVLADTFRPPVASEGSCRVGVVGSGPDEGPSALWFALVQAIGEARDTIMLSSPYLVMPPTLQFALQLAAARGVRVRIYTNGARAEAAFLYHAQRHH